LSIFFRAIEFEQQNQVNGTVGDQVHFNRVEMPWILILLGLAFGVLILVLCRSVVYYGLMGKIARLVHRRVVNAVMSSPLQYVQENESKLERLLEVVFLQYFLYSSSSSSAFAL
jgi:hypothetical protein